MARSCIPLSGVGLLLAGCSMRVLEPVGPVGEGERTLLLNSLAIMLCIVVPTIVATLGFAWWFRAGNGKAKRLPQWSFSGTIEIVTWSVPLMTIIFLGGIAWIGAHELDPGKPLASDRKTLEIQVVSLDWKWLFIYPDQKVAAVNQLVLPAGTPVHFALTSASVWNSFFVPQFGSQIYTMGGMTSYLNLQADKPGTYLGFSTHLSGDGFAGMNFAAKVMTPDDFAGWVTGAQGDGPTLDEAAYTTLAKQSIDNPPMTYRSIDPTLFGKVVSQAIPPGPGPEPGHPTSNVTASGGN